MDWDGLTSFLQEIRVFLEHKNNHMKEQSPTVDSLIEKCEFYISTSRNLRFNDEVDMVHNPTETYLDMAGTNNKIIIDSAPDPVEHSEYIDMDEYNSTPAECPYTGLPFAHLKLNKNVIITKENMKISGRKSAVTVTCAFLRDSWLLYYSSAKPTALKPTKYFKILSFEQTTDQSLQLQLKCEGDSDSLVLHFDSGSVREMWIRAMREELYPELEDGVYDDPNNLRLDEHLYKTLQFNYDIPKMPPKPVATKSSRSEFSLKYQEIQEQLSSQLKQQKEPQEKRSQRSSSLSPQKKFGKFMSMFKSSSTSATNSNPSYNEGGESLKKSKILKHKRNTTIFSPDYEIVGS